MEDINNSQLGLNLFNVDYVRKYESLEKQFQAVSIELDSCKQQLHQAQRESDLQKELQNTLEADYETLQLENKDQKQRFQFELQKLREQYKTTIASLNDSNETHLLKIKNLENQIKSTNPVNDSKSKKISEENETLQNELFQIKIVNEDLTKTLEDTKSVYSETISENKVLKQNLGKLQEELQQVRRILEQKNEDIRNENVCRESLQEELVMLRAELMEFKSTTDGPHKAKGNSLFGEVYDSRQNLQKKVALMKRQYLEMKSKYSRQLTEFQKVLDQRLRLDLNIKFQQTPDFQDLYNASYTWQKMHEKTIKDLRDIIKQQNETLKTLNPGVPSKIPDDSKGLYATISQLYDRLKEESVNYAEALKEKAIIDLQSSLLLHDTQRELHQWKNTAATLKNEKLCLLLEVEKLKLESSTITPAVFEDESIILEGTGSSLDKEN